MMQSIVLAQTAWKLANFAYRFGKVGFPVAWRLVRLAERLDREHWRHWVYDHNATGCAAGKCVKCGGTICTQNFSDGDAK